MGAFKRCLFASGRGICLNLPQAICHFIQISVPYVRCSNCRQRPPVMNETQTITELARDFGVTTRAIRYWESHGLVSP